ncbi:hypothetical protein BKA70DRAFT_1270023 [Coprinopsis sp. MPI-PUGE-AT-0042]|nr:hypothetical protein BKA70DRAFT_1270023 [Coprinopsis sp. MPI-PUGE-AT-0042]
MLFNSITTISLFVALLSSSVMGVPVPGAFDAELDAREPMIMPMARPPLLRRPTRHLIKREAQHKLVTREPIMAIHPALFNKRPIGGGLGPLRRTRITKREGDEDLAIREPMKMMPAVHPAMLNSRPIGLSPLRRTRVSKRDADEDLAIREPLRIMPAIHRDLLYRRPIGGGLIKREATEDLETREPLKFRATPAVHPALLHHFKSRSYVDED